MKRVAAVMTNSLLVTGIATMLEAQSGLEVYSVGSSSIDLAEKLSEFDPDVIVIDGSDCEFSSRFPIESLLQDHPDVTVIAISLRKPQIRVYRHRTVEEANSDDLLRIISAS